MYEATLKRNNLLSLKIMFPILTLRGKNYLLHKAKQNKAWTYTLYYKLTTNIYANIYVIHTYTYKHISARKHIKCYHLCYVKNVCVFLSLNLFVSSKFSISIFYNQKMLITLKDQLRLILPCS